MPTLKLALTLASDTGKPPPPPKAPSSRASFSGGLQQTCEGSLAPPPPFCVTARCVAACSPSAFRIKLPNFSIIYTTQSFSFFPLASHTIARTRNKRFISRKTPSPITRHNFSDLFFWTRIPPSSSIPNLDSFLLSNHFSCSHRRQHRLSLTGASYPLHLSFTSSTFHHRIVSDIKGSNLATLVAQLQGPYNNTLRPRHFHIPSRLCPPHQHFGNIALHSFPIDKSLLPPSRCIDKLQQALGPKTTEGQHA